MRAIVPYRIYPLLGMAALALGAGLAWAQTPPQCVDCHTPSADVAVHAVFNTPHAGLGGGGSDTCRACHGDSNEHRDAPSDAAPDISFGPRWPAGHTARSDRCLSCHEKGSQMLWAGSEHQREELACDNCHDSHQQRDPALASRRSGELCGSCHQRQRAESRLPSRHPIAEGKTACADCHNPHGGLGDAALHQVSVNENCLSCHQEKRGPFLWEHPPVTEDCGLCHRPHGSVNDRLLTARGPGLCQQCHSAAFHPSLPYGGEGTATASRNATAPNQNLLGKNCMNCHSQVHGSNHPSGARLTR